MMITKQSKHFFPLFKPHAPFKKEKEKEKEKHTPIHHIIMDTYTRQQMDGGS